MDKSPTKKARTAKTRSPKGKSKLKLQQQSKQPEATPQPEYIKLSPISDDEEESQSQTSPPLSPNTNKALSSMLGVMQGFANANNCLNPVLLEDVNYTNSSPSGSSNKFKRKIVVTSYQPQVTLQQPTIVSHTIVKPRTTTTQQASLPVPVVQQAQLPVQQAQQPPEQQVQVSVHQPVARQPPIVQPPPVVQADAAPPQEGPFNKRQRVMHQIFSADFDCISELVINNQDNLTFRYRHLVVYVFVTLLLMVILLL